MNDLEKAIKTLRRLRDIQGDSCNTNDTYMIGMYNGLEVALSVLEDRDGDFKECKNDIIDKNKVENLNKFSTLGEIPIDIETNTTLDEKGNKRNVIIFKP